MSEYWKHYWARHAASLAAGDPFRQVLRTLNGEPQTMELLQRISDRIVEELDLQPNHRVLDLCCGNGLLSAELARRCRRVIGVDFCKSLVAETPRWGQRNIAMVVGDVDEIRFLPACFDRVTVFAALQHLSEAEVARLLARLERWLRPGGVVLLTDIPDRARMWSFYDDAGRESDYFEALRGDAPILGTWFDRSWLEKAAAHVGFIEPCSVDQPEDWWFAHYRFDFLCTKPLARSVDSEGVEV